MTDRGPGLIRSTSELMAPQAPVNLTPPAQGAPPAQSWLEQQQTKQASYQAPAPQQVDEKHAEEEAKLEALRQEYGSTEVISGKFAQGALDALLAPGALAGAYAESVGELFHSKALRDFGRGLGESSTGREAMASMGGLAQAALEGSAYKGAEFRDAATKRLEEAEEARPMLATISRMAGMSASAIGLGLGAAGESGTAATIAANVGEGAAGGAQTAYEHAAPLRDVLASTAVGGALGGAIAGAGEGIQALVRKTPDLAKVFGEKAQDFADSRALKSVIDRDPAAWKTFLRGGKERVARVAERIRAADVLGKSDDGMLEAINQGAHESSENLAKIATHLDDSGIVPDVATFREKLMSQVDELAGSGSGTIQGIGDTIKRETQPFFDKLAVKEVDKAGNEVVVGYRNPSFSELRSFKQDLGAAKSALMRSNSPAADEMRRLYGNVAESLNEAADHAGPGVSRLWKESNEAATDFITLRDALENQIARKMKNRFVSPSDYGTSIGAGLATAVMSGNPLMGGLAAIGTALGHKAVREGGSALVSSLANRFARMSSHVSLLKAGGPEAQEVLSALSKTKAFMAETAERAGANPTLRQGASETAKQVAAKELARKAGPFNPATWAEKPLNPLQKVLYRSQVLDTVSNDLAKTAEATAALHPELPAELDIRRLAKLTKDAKGPEAIGALQQLVGESAKVAPATASGDATGVLLRNLGLKLERADTAQAMNETHTAANWLRVAQEHAQDDASREYMLRTEQALRDSLSSEEWGKAGQAYGQMVAPPHEALGAMANPEEVRAALAAGGHDLRETADAVHNRLAAAYDARAQLSGMARPDGLEKQLSVGKRIFEAAQEAVTLDGKPMRSLIENATSSGLYGADASRVDSVNGSTVQEHVDRGLDKLAPVLRGAPARETSELATTAPLSREQYDGRLKTLTRALSQPEATAEHAVYAGIAPYMSQALVQLQADMPKPTNSVHGKAFETMSQDDLRLANAMWEATTEPLTVLSDLAAGSLDPDKAAYAWKQYPGLQKAVQAGVVDDLMGLNDEQRTNVPESVLSQIDTAIGFNGALQDANDPGFAARMSQLYQPAPNKPQPGGMLKTPMAEPTYTERLSGQE